MKRVRRWLLGVVASFLLVGAIPVVAEQQASPQDPIVTNLAEAETPPESLNGVRISEIQTGSLTSTSEEFIELYNTSDDNIDLTGWEVQYYSATVSDFTKAPTRTMHIQDILARADHYLLASTGYLSDQAQTSFAAGLAASGGYLRLVDLEGEVSDLVGWGKASALAEGGRAVLFASASIGLPAGNSIVRRINEDGILQDTDNNEEDFVETSTPTPQQRIETILPADPEPDEEPGEATPESESVPEQPEPNETTDPTTSPEVTPIEEIESQVIVLEITELLPNPASPLTDSDDEFVELYNPGDVAVDLAEYKLQTGASFSYTVPLTGIVIQPKGFTVIYSKDTNLTLSNSGGNARLLGPDGDVVATATVYEVAPDGQVWASYDGVWQWSSTATPGSGNILTAVAAEAKKDSTTKTTSKAPAKKTTKKATKTTTTKAAKKDTTSKDSAATAVPPEEEVATPLHPAVLAGVGALALGYGAYEYREDAVNKLRRLKSNRRYRRAARATA